MKRKRCEHGKPTGDICDACADEFAAEWRLRHVETFPTPPPFLRRIGAVVARAAGSFR